MACNSSQNSGRENVARKPLVIQKWFPQSVTEQRFQLAATRKRLMRKIYTDSFGTVVRLVEFNLPYMKVNGNKDFRN